MGTQFSDRTTSFHRRTNKTKNLPKPTKEKKPKKTNTNEFKKPNLVNGQVTLLRRGESLSSVKLQEPVFNFIDVNKPVLNLLDVNKPGFNLLDVKKPGFNLLDVKKPGLVLPDVMFAGSGITSPSPRKLPKPLFLSRVREEEGVDDVSKDLRRMLRLE